MKRILLALALVVTGCAGAPDNGSVFVEVRGCWPRSYDLAKLEALRASGFVIADEQERQAFALGIAQCLGDPDSRIRDGIAFEALSTMMRGKQLTTGTLRRLLVGLEARMAAEEDEPEILGFEQPFAALALSEVARTDRIAAWMTDQEFAELVDKARGWLTGWRDYRGFDAREGWRHGVAHGADLLMQLALNPRVTQAQLRRIVEAVGAQVAPGGHAYVDAESERLARPVLFAAARGAMSEAEWTDWLGKLAALPASTTAQAYLSTEAGLAWRHNVMGFLQALYVDAATSPDKADDVLLPGLTAALGAMPPS